MTTITLGYVIISNDIMQNHQPVAYAYRDAPDDEQDSSWRFMSGRETQDDDASHWAL